MNEKYVSDPRWLPKFSLSTEAKEQVAELIGKEKLSLIIFLCRQFLLEKENEAFKPRLADFNKRGRKLHECMMGFEKEVGVKGTARKVKIPGIFELLQEVEEISEDDAICGEIKKMTDEEFAGSVSELRKEIRSINASLSYYKNSIVSLRESIGPGGNRPGYWAAQKDFVEKLCKICCESGMDTERANSHGSVIIENEVHLLAEILASEMGVPYKSQKAWEDENGNKHARISGLEQTVEACLKEASKNRNNPNHWAYHYWDNTTS